MISRNPHFANLSESYLFREIAKRVADFREQNPGISLHNLGIGDTTIPLPEEVTTPLAEYAVSLSTKEGYTGYQQEQGSLSLRALIANILYNKMVTPDEIFISDGAKCDIGRLQLLLSHLSPVLIQDPTYPVYRDGTQLMGTQQLFYAQCLPENDFFPVFSESPKLIYLCSPNNPTGTALSFSQLESLVRYAKQKGALIVFDAAYSGFIADDTCPKSIYEIPGAKQVAIEVNSFSKLAGFTGIRLGWSIVPPELGQLHKDFFRLHSTVFNGASILAQKAGELVLTHGLKQSKAAINEYKTNVKMMREVMQTQGYTVYGGVHSPYLWVQIPGATSWESFDRFLKTVQLIVTPGSGFGPAGEGFIRLSGFFDVSKRACVERALSEVSILAHE